MKETKKELKQKLNELEIQLEDFDRLYREMNDYWFLLNLKHLIEHHTRRWGDTIFFFMLSFFLFLFGILIGSSI